MQQHWSLRNLSLAPIHSSDYWRSAPLDCYPSSFRADSYSACSGIATVIAGTARSYNDCPDHCWTSPQLAYRAFTMSFPALSWCVCCPARTTLPSPLIFLRTDREQRRGTLSAYLSRYRSRRRTIPGLAPLQRTVAQGDSGWQCAHNSRAYTGEWAAGYSSASAFS